jgi:hypothetical protein
MPSSTVPVNFHTNTQSKVIESASDIIDYEKIEGRPGKMLIVLGKITDKDTIVISYSESKRTFYKTLSKVSQIIKSISIIR